MTDEARVRALIDGLQLGPHPEGGFFREMFRSPSAVRPTDGRPVRSALTAIFYLLPRGAESAWHRVASDEVWHFYEGAALELCQVAPDMTAVTKVRLSPALHFDGPMHTVPASWWQRARPLGGYTLVGCSVGPGFDFADFEMAQAGSDQVAILNRLA